MEDRLQPIILNVGRRKRRVTKDLKRGRGRLMDKVEETLDEVRAQLGAAAEGKEIVPLLMIFRYKRQRQRRGISLF